MARLLLLTVPSVTRRDALPPRVKEVSSSYLSSTRGEVAAGSGASSLDPRE